MASAYISGYDVAIDIGTLWSHDLARERHREDGVDPEVFVDAGHRVWQPRL